MRHRLLFVLFFVLSIAHQGHGQTFESIVMQTALPTVTVRGFLNFRTTVDGTVIVFTPASASAASSTLQPSSVQPLLVSTPAPAQPTFPSNNVQPTPNLPTPASNAGGAYPTGLVTVLASTQVNGGQTTELETRVFGTYINGKYAQILKSNARLIQPTAVVVSTSTPIQTPSPFKPYGWKPNDSNQEQQDEPKRVDSREMVDRADDLKPDDRNPVTIKRNRLNRLGVGTGRFQSRSQNKLHLNRMKTAKPVTQKIKEEEEAAKQINQRFSKRLGVNRIHPVFRHQMTQSPLQSTSPAPAPAQPNAESIESNRRQMTVESIDELAESINSGKDENRSLDPESASGLLESAPKATFSSAIVNNGLQSEDSAAIAQPSAPTDPLLLKPTALANRLNELTGEDDLLDQPQLATPPLILTRTYSLDESSTRTSIVPMLMAGGGVENQTITEAFVMHKMITAYRTLPPGDLLLLNTEDPTLVPSMQEIYPLANLSDYWQPFPSMTNRSQVSHNGGEFVASSTYSPLNFTDPVLLQKALQQPTLAALYSALQRLQQQMSTMTQVVRPTERLHSSTVYQTKRISYYDGRRTRTRFLTDFGSVVTATETLFTTELVPTLNSALLPQQQQLRYAFASHLKQFAQSMIGSSASQTSSNIQPTSVQPLSESIDSTVLSSNSAESVPSNNVMASVSSAMTPQISSASSTIDSFLQPSSTSFAPIETVATVPSSTAVLPDLFGSNAVTKTILKTVTSVSSVTNSHTRIYTLIYNGFSTKYRTVTSTSIIPSTVTIVSTQLITSTPAIDLNALLG